MFHIYQCVCVYMDYIYIYSWTIRRKTRVGWYCRLIIFLLSLCICVGSVAKILGWQRQSAVALHIALISFRPGPSDSQRTSATNAKENNENLSANLTPPPSPQKNEWLEFWQPMSHTAKAVSLATTTLYVASRAVHRYIDIRLFRGFSGDRRPTRHDIYTYLGMCRYKCCTATNRSFIRLVYVLYFNAF